jgi:hypothetical protein
MKTLYLYTRDKQGFYSKIGYKECEPVQIYGTRVLGQNYKNVPSNETAEVRAVSPTFSVPSVSNTYPQTRTLVQPNTHLQPEPPPPLPPPPPPPLPPKPVYSATSRPSYTCMKKNL